MHQVCVNCFKKAMLTRDALHLQLAPRERSLPPMRLCAFVLGPLLHVGDSNTPRQVHLGKYTGFGIAYVTTDDPGPLPPGAAFNGSFSGGVVFVAANGRRLVCEHPGTFAVYPNGEGGFYAIFDATFTLPA